MKCSETYISVDVESTGVLIGQDNLASIGACIVGNTDDKFYIELKPITERYNLESLDICGFSISYLKEHGVLPRIAMRLFSEWVKRRRPCAFVGWNASFDFGFIDFYSKKFIGRNPFGISPIDIKAYYMGMVNCDWRLTTKRLLPERFKPNQKHTHNALQDAVEQAEIFQKMLEYNHTKIG